MTNSVLINDDGRAPVIAQRRDGDGLLLHARGTVIALSRAEITRLVDFLIGDSPHAVSPAKARWNDD
jgi:hypothetical protein